MTLIELIIKYRKLFRLHGQYEAEQWLLSITDKELCTHIVATFNANGEFVGFEGNVLSANLKERFPERKGIQRLRLRRMIYDASCKMLHTPEYKYKDSEEANKATGVWINEVNRLEVIEAFGDEHRAPHDPCVRARLARELWLVRKLLKTGRF